MGETQPTNINWGPLDVWIEHQKIIENQQGGKVGQNVGRSEKSSPHGAMGWGLTLNSGSGGSVTRVSHQAAWGYSLFSSSLDVLLCNLQLSIPHRILGDFNAAWVCLKMGHAKTPMLCHHLPYIKIDGFKPWISDPHRITSQLFSFASFRQHNSCHSPHCSSRPRQHGTTGRQRRPCGPCGVPAVSTLCCFKYSRSPSRIRGPRSQTIAPPPSWLFLQAKSIMMIFTAITGVIIVVIIPNICIIYIYMCVCV
jgi:hypothetical protein